VASPYASFLLKNIMSDLPLLDEYDGRYYEQSWRTTVSFFIAAFSITMCLLGMFYIAVIITTRKFTYNLYIIFIMLPDAMLNAIEGIKWIVEANNNGVIPISMCYLRYFLIIFYYCSNLYVNAVVAMQVHHLVLNSYKRKRTIPPSVQKVFKQVAAVYIFSLAFAGWFVAPLRISPITVTYTNFCAIDFGSESFGATSGMMVLLVAFVPPMCYVFWIGYQVRKQKLLPLKGRTRALAFFFLRIVIIFMAIYAPMLILAIVSVTIPPEEHDSTFSFLLNSVWSLLNPIQNVVTIYFLSQKDDIAAAIRVSLSRISCFRKNNDDDDDVNSGEWALEDTYQSNSQYPTAIFRTSDISSGFATVSFPVFSVSGGAKADADVDADADALAVDVSDTDADADDIALAVALAEP